MNRMENCVFDDQCKRSVLPARENKRALLRFIIRNSYTQLVPRALAQVRLNKLMTHYSITEQRSRCRFSGRSHFVLTRAGLSRMFFRDAAGQGLLGGVYRRGM